MKLPSSEQDTIVAIATPVGTGASIGMIRLSGADAIRIADAMFVSKAKTRVENQKSFTVQYGHIYSHQNKHKQLIDEVLLLLMRGPKSYTRQDVVEISAHGGQACLRAIVDESLRLGCRLAEPGEFTKRAFLNGRIDLVQAEAVMDLIEAKTDLGRRFATSQLEGVLSKKLGVVKENLIGVMSHLEAAVDFPDDFPDVQSNEKTLSDLLQAKGVLSGLLQSAELGFVAKSGAKAVLFGRPNVGKSSLMNALCGKNRVIVTPIAGTTRDIVEEQTQIRGIPIRLVDTAGIRETVDVIEKEGVARSRNAVAGADVALLVLDAFEGIREEDKVFIEALNPDRSLIILNKSDLIDANAIQNLANTLSKFRFVYTSCLSGHGLKLLESELFRLICDGKAEVSDETVISSARQKDLLFKAVEQMDNAILACRNHLSPEFIAADVSQALHWIGVTTGEVCNEDILDQVFSRFCIGK